MTNDDAPVLDDAVLAELRESTGGDDDFVRELVDAYVSEATGYLEAMTVAAAAEDADAMVRPAHTLKSSSATLGAMRLAGISRTLEESARSGRADDFAADVERAQAAWASTLTVIPSMLAQSA